jgi:hypothetical protein
VIYDTDPSHWNEAIYPSGVFGDGPVEKVRIQTGLRFAVNGGTAGFWVGLFVPWLRNVFARFKSSRT